MTERQGSLQYLHVVPAPDHASQPPEPASFAATYRAEVAQVWRCLRRLGVADADLEDKVHDVFVIAYRRWADYDAARPARPWLAGIALRVASDYRRAAPRRRECTRELSEAVDPRSLPDAAVAERQARELVLAALEALDEDRRAVFVLHELEGYSVPEIATIVSAPLNTLYSRLRLAREDFAAAVRRCGVRGCP
ncbi:MAG: sigma-70 family RNA polymerase sigma factor [Deltaproteobacteria bacterium]|nr:sigma-70 family RNA polymerase sigma factor [Deltaproteobacteria bacterium]